MLQQNVSVVRSQYIGSKLKGSCKDTYGQDIVMPRGKGS